MGIVQPFENKKAYHPANDQTLCATERSPGTMINARERRILLITCFGHFLSHTHMLVFPALVLPLTSLMTLDLSHVLELSFWMYLFFGVTALPWGMLADRWGAKRLLLLFFAGGALSCLAAAHWVTSPSSFLIALAALGIFSGIYHPAGLGLISKELRHVSLGMGYNGMAGNLGLATAPLLAGLINWLWGPAAVYLILAALNLAGIALMLSFPLSETPPVQATAAAGDNDGNLNAFLILLVAMMLGGIAYRGATVIFPAYFQLRSAWLVNALTGLWGWHLSANVVATGITSIIFLAGIFGQYSGGRLAQRFDARYIYLIFHLTTLPAVFLMAATANLALGGLAMVYFFFLLGMQPAENTLVARFSSKRLHHSAYGTKFVLTFGVGSLAVKLVQYIETNWGLTFVFPALGLVSVLLVGAILVLIRRTSQTVG